MPIDKESGLWLEPTPSNDDDSSLLDDDESWRDNIPSAKTPPVEDLPSLASEAIDLPNPATLSLASDDIGAWEEMEPDPIVEPEEKRFRAYSGFEDMPTRQKRIAPPEAPVDTTPVGVSSEEAPMSSPDFDQELDNRREFTTIGDEDVPLVPEDTLGTNPTRNTLLSLLESGTLPPAMEDSVVRKYVAHAVAESLGLRGERPNDSRFAEEGRSSAVGYGEASTTYNYVEDPSYSFSKTGRVRVPESYEGGDRRVDVSSDIKNPYTWNKSREDKISDFVEMAATDKTGEVYEDFSKSSEDYRETIIHEELMGLSPEIRKKVLDQVPKYVKTTEGWGAEDLLYVTDDVDNWVVSNLGDLSAFAMAIPSVGLGLGLSAWEGEQTSLPGEPTTPSWRQQESKLEAELVRESLNFEDDASSPYRPLQMSNQLEENQNAFAMLGWSSAGNLSIRGPLAGDPQITPDFSIPVPLFQSSDIIKTLLPENMDNLTDALTDHVQQQLRVTKHIAGKAGDMHTYDIIPPQTKGGDSMHMQAPIQDNPMMFGEGRTRPYIETYPDADDPEVQRIVKAITYSFLTDGDPKEFLGKHYGGYAKDFPFSRYWAQQTTNEDGTQSGGTLGDKIQTRLNLAVEYLDSRNARRLAHQEAAAMGYKSSDFSKNEIINKAYGVPQKDVGLAEYLEIIGNLDIKIDPKNPQIVSRENLKRAVDIMSVRMNRAVIREMALSGQLGIEFEARGESEQDRSRIADVAAYYPTIGYLAKSPKFKSMFTSYVGELGNSITNIPHDMYISLGAVIKPVRDFMSPEDREAADRKWKHHKLFALVDVAGISAMSGSVAKLSVNLASTVPAAVKAMPAVGKAITSRAPLPQPLPRNHMGEAINHFKSGNKELGMVSLEQAFDESAFLNSMERKGAELRDALDPVVETYQSFKQDYKNYSTPADAVKEKIQNPKVYNRAEEVSLDLSKAESTIVSLENDARLLMEEAKTVRGKGDDVQADKLERIAKAKESLAETNRDAYTNKVEGAEVIELDPLNRNAFSMADEIEGKVGTTEDLFIKQMDADDVLAAKDAEYGNSRWGTSKSGGAKRLKHELEERGIAKNISAEEKAIQLASDGVDDIYIFRNLLPGASNKKIAEYAARGREKKMSKGRSVRAEALKTIAEETNRTVAEVIENIDDIAVADFVSRYDSQPYTYAAMGLNDEYIKFFSEKGESATKSGLYVQSKPKGSSPIESGSGEIVGIVTKGRKYEISPTPAGEAPRASKHTGMGQLLLDNLFGERAVRVGRATIDPNKRTSGAVIRKATYAVAEFMYRPFAFANIPSWYQDLLVLGLDNLYARNLTNIRGGMETFLNFLITPKRRIGTDLYAEIAGQEGKAGIAAVDIDAIVSELPREGESYAPTQARAEKVLAAAEILDDTVDADHLKGAGYAKIQADDLSVTLQAIHENANVEVIDAVTGKRYKPSEVIELQIDIKNKLEIELSDLKKQAPDEVVSSRIADIEQRLSTGDVNVNVNDVYPNLKELDASLDTKVRERADAFSKDPLDPILATMDSQIDSLRKTKAKMSVTDKEALEGVGPLRYKNVKPWKDMDDFERTLLIAANEYVKPVQQLIFDDVAQLIMADEVTSLLYYDDSLPKSIVLQREGNDWVIAKIFKSDENGATAAASFKKSLDAKKNKAEGPQVIVHSDQALDTKIPGTGGVTQRTVQDVSGAKPDGLPERVDTRIVSESNLRSEMMNVEGRGKDLKVGKLVKFQGNTVIPQLAHYLSLYVDGAAVATKTVKLLQRIKETKNPLLVQEMVDSYIMKMLSGHRRGAEFLEIHGSNPKAALSALMEMAPGEQVSAFGRELTQNERFYGKQAFGNLMTPAELYELSASYKYRAIETHLELRQNIQAAAFQKHLRDNKYLITKDEFDLLPSKEKGFYEASSETKAWQDMFTAGISRAFALSKAPQTFGSKFQNLHIHRGVAEHYARQQGLQIAQSRFLNQAFSSWKLGAVVNPFTGTMARNIIGMIAFQGWAMGPIPFDGSRVAAARKGIRQIREGKVPSDPRIRELWREGLMEGGIKEDFGDIGFQKAETFLNDLLEYVGDTGKLIGDVRNAKSEKAITRLAEKLLAGTLESRISTFADDMKITQDPKARQVPATRAKGMGPAVKGATMEGYTRLKNFYGSIDEVGRIAYGLQLMDRLKISARKAATYSRETMFDYGDISTAMNYLRYSGFGYGVPFIGYSANANTALAHMLTQKPITSLMMTQLMQVHNEATEQTLKLGVSMESMRSAMGDQGLVVLPSWQLEKSKSGEWYGQTKDDELITMGPSSIGSSNFNQWGVTGDAGGTLMENTPSNLDDFTYEDITNTAITLISGLEGPFPDVASPPEVAAMSERKLKNEEHRQIVQEMEMNLSQLDDYNRKGFKRAVDELLENEKSLLIDAKPYAVFLARNFPFIHGFIKGADKMSAAWGGPTALGSEAYRGDRLSFIGLPVAPVDMRKLDKSLGLPKSMTSKLNARIDELNVMRATAELFKEVSGKNPHDYKPILKMYTDKIDLAQATLDAIKAENERVSGVRDEQTDTTLRLLESALKALRAEGRITDEEYYRSKLRDALR